jgi:hypothetical protein
VTQAKSPSRWRRGSGSVNLNLNAAGAERWCSESSCWAPVSLETSDYPPAGGSFVCESILTGGLVVQA